jgi:hypothetical protein
MSIESPKYEVVKKVGTLELRRYATYLTASVRVSAASYNEAANVGFGVLADYIFGNNSASGTIPMTAPVTAGPASGTKMAMTAPVTSERARNEQMETAAPLCTVRCPGEYVVSFTMPSRFNSVEDLPVPNDPRVALETVSAHLAVVARFGGYLTDKSAAQAQARLETWMFDQGLTPAGEPVSAQYDAPWKPPFARRNEILIPVENAPSDLH